MSYCEKLTNNKAIDLLDILLLKDILNLDPDDTSFDNKIIFYFSVAVQYIENTYDVVIINNIFRCSYNKDYFNLPRYNTPTGVEIRLPKPVREVFDVSYVTKLPSIGIIPGDIERTDIYYLIDTNIISLPYDYLYSPQYYLLYPYIWNCWAKTDCIEVTCMLGWDKDNMPLDLLQVLFALTTEMFYNNGQCDCSKVCSDSINSKILNNYTTYVG